MKKSSLYLILTYGLFLGWLLSFLYNGPALDIIFNNGRINSGYLAIAYILTPSIISFYMGFYNIKEKYSSFFMKYSIILCFIGTIISVLIRDLSNFIPIYILVGTMGIFSVFFIMGWGCYFVDLLDIKIMYKYMAYVICLGNILFHVNEVLKYQGLNSIVITSLFICLLGAYYTSSRMITIAKEKRQDFNIELSIELLVMMCFLMFLLNIGGGMVQTLVSPLAESSFGNIHILDTIMYLLIGVLIYKMEKKLPSEILITIAIVMIACGYMSLIFWVKSPVPAYVLIVLGYAILDIFLWTLVGEMGYIFGSPIKIFTFIMASNLMAVFMGNLLGVFLTNTKEQTYIAIAVSAICTVLAFTFLPFINQLMKRGVGKMEEVKATREAVKGVITEEKAVKLLTTKELEIYKLMLLGLKNKEIAEKANISYNTLKGHARNIYGKFGVSNKKELLSSLSKEEIS